MLARGTPYRTITCKKLQDFIPGPDRYNVIYSQFVTQFLNDTELIQLLKKLRHSLVEGGIIVIRENSAP